MFGGTKPIFGAANNSTGFGEFKTDGTSSCFGQSFSNTTIQPAFGTASIGAIGQPANLGTSITKYQPTDGSDCIKNGPYIKNVSTKYHFISAMKEYEGKSLEELRMEDYLANRKGPQAATAAGFSGFGAITQPGTGSSIFVAGTQPSTGLFGQPVTGATENKGLFGQPISPFGRSAVVGFEAPANPFRQNQALRQILKPSFDRNPARSSAPVFGETSTRFGNLFNANRAPVFGNIPPFGAPPQPNTAAVFGPATAGFATAAGQQQQPSLYGQHINCNSLFTAILNIEMKM